MQLFSKAGGRPFANIIMRKKFGTLVDAPTPKEYIDPTQSFPEAINTLMNAIQNGTECFVDCYVRTLDKSNPLSTICVKPILGKQGNVLYTLILWLDISTGDIEQELNHLNYIVQAMS
jgi:hypothetical protein